jgi:hypothetical protein
MAGTNFRCRDACEFSVAAEVGHLERMLAGEMQWAMQRMLPQYHALAELLLPPSLVPKDMPWAPSEEKPQTEQRTLNLGE